LSDVLSRKNPYLFRTKGITTPRELIKAILDARLSSSEETIFGSFLEDLAVDVSRKTFNGDKSAIPGLDLEFIKDGVKYFVAIKSGPNWSNSEQVKKLESAFKQARKVYAQNKSGHPVECVNGCCYGKEPAGSEHQGGYLKLCGQRFWALISGDPELYLKIMESMGHQAEERYAEFQAEYETVLETLTKEFQQLYCDGNGVILWDKLTEAYSKAPDSN
jgi:hypothetical protein